MKKAQYVIKQLDTGFIVRWGDAPILFDSQEEAEEILLEAPPLFGSSTEVEICRGVFFIDDSVNYSDLKKNQSYNSYLSYIKKTERRQ